MYLYVIVESPTRPLGLYAVCLRDPPHRLTIYAVDDSSPWSHARAQWRQASRAMAALLALHQNPGKISLGLGASCSVPHLLQENTFRTATFRAAVRLQVGSKTHERPYSQVGKTGRVTDTRENVGIECSASPSTCLLHLGLSNRRRLRSLTLT